MIYALLASTAFGMVFGQCPERNNCLTECEKTQSRYTCLKNDCPMSLCVSGARSTENAGGKPDGAPCAHDTECGGDFCNPDTKTCDNDYHDAEHFGNEWMGQVKGHESHSRSTGVDELKPPGRNAGSARLERVYGSDCPLEHWPCERTAGTARDPDYDPTCTHNCWGRSLAQPQERSWGWMPKGWGDIAGRTAGNARDPDYDPTCTHNCWGRSLAQPQERSWGWMPKGWGDIAGRTSGNAR